LKETVLAKRYAKALFEISHEKGHLEDIFHELETFGQAIERNENLRLFWYSQDINRKKKIETAEMLLNKRISDDLFRFILLLFKKNREYLFAVVVHEFKRLVDRFLKRVHATAITAFPLDEKPLTDLKTYLDSYFHADVDIENRVNTDILGGIIVNVEGRVFDGSLHSQLMRLKQQLKETVDVKIS